MSDTCHCIDPIPILKSGQDKTCKRCGKWFVYKWWLKDSRRFEAIKKQKETDDIVNFITKPL